MAYRDQRFRSTRQTKGTAVSQASDWASILGWFGITWETIVDWLNPIFNPIPVILGVLLAGAAALLGLRQEKLANPAPQTTVAPVTTVTVSPVVAIPPTQIFVQPVMLPAITVPAPSLQKAAADSAAERICHKIDIAACTASDSCDSEGIARSFDRSVACSQETENAR